MLTVINIHCKNEIWNLYQFRHNLATTLGIQKSGTYEAYTDFMEYELHTYTFVWILYHSYISNVIQIWNANHSFACHIENSMFLIFQMSSFLS